jgi:tRNA(Arg) A34 adenosine deaminase TadA/pimeloyl-ACP methyl ester carboxylesterase
MLSGVVSGVAIVASCVYVSYRRGMNRGRARLDAVERRAVSTRWGLVEFAERGSGDPVLVVHGIFHNCVGGLFSVRDFTGRRFIAPSRFGYLGSSMPPRATPEDQADALAALLDALAIDRVDVIGESAGATSALQLALRHPERVKHLALLVGNLPGSPTAVVQPSWAKLLNRQFPLWLLWTFAPSVLVHLVTGLPKGFAMSREDSRFVAEFIDSLFPVSPKGVDFDAFVGNAAVNDYKLEAIEVRTLIVHTKDDHIASHEASKHAAERISGARFVSLESGGHLMLGQTKIVGDELARFFGAPQHERHMRRCIELARHAFASGDAPVGSLIVDGDEIVSDGVEAVRARGDATAHAEMEALRAAFARRRSRDLTGCTLYTSVAPCIMCAYAIRLARISVVVCGARGGDDGQPVSGHIVLTDVRVAPHRPPPAVIRDVLVQECERLKQSTHHADAP